MVNENNSSLFEIYQNFFDEAEVLENEIKENEFSISETEDYLDQLYNLTSLHTHLKILALLSLPSISNSRFKALIKSMHICMYVYGYGYKISFYLYYGYYFLSLPY